MYIELAKVERAGYLRLYKRVEEVCLNRVYLFKLCKRSLSSKWYYDIQKQLKVICSLLYTTTSPACSNCETKTIRMLCFFLRLENKINVTFYHTPKKKMTHS